MARSRSFYREGAAKPCHKRWHILTVQIGKHLRCFLLRSWVIPNQERIRRPSTVASERQIEIKKISGSTNQPQQGLNHIREISSLCRAFQAGLGKELVPSASSLNRHFVIGGSG